jgi:hypothetical protein
MRFEFRLTGHGSATAEIGDEASHVTIVASAISDPLGDLLHALWRLMEGEPETQCSWEDEPGEYRWIMTRLEGVMELRVLEFDQSHPRLPDESGRLVLRTRQSLPAFARAIALGASRTLELNGDAGYRERWFGRPFPSRTLALIQAALRT